MARLYFAGAEINAGAGTAAQNTGPDGVATGTVTRDTTIFRSAGGGVASWKCDTTASGFTAFITPPAITFAASTTYYFRGYFRISANPTNNTTFIRFGGAAGQVEVRKNGTGGSIALGFGGVFGTNSASITDSNWHLIELQATTGATTWTTATLTLDGTVVQTNSVSPPTFTSGLSFGPLTTGDVSWILNMDDFALNDSTGAANNSAPGAGGVVLLKPTADSAVGTGWTTSSASGSGLFNNVNITPPAGIADTTASNLHQIRNATANANVSYDATMTTYTAAGVGSLDTVNAVVEVVATAAPVTTSSKQGTFGIVSNPTVANVALNATGTSGAFWAGATAGTFGAGWKWSTGAIQNAPTVTLGTAPVARITQVTSSTRIAMCCAMFIYVDYTPFVSTVHIRNPAINFADPAFV